MLPKTLGIYQLNKIYQVDCISGLAALPSDSLDLVFADPPYNNGTKYGPGHDDNLPLPDYLAWCGEWFAGAARVLKPGGACYVMHYPEMAAQWKLILDEMLTFQRWISWVYPSNIGQSNGNWSRSHRTVLYYTKGEAAAYFNGMADPQPYRNPDDRRIALLGKMGKTGTTPYDWWDFNLVKNTSADKTTWPNQLPEELLRRIILTSCPPGGVVCDPFMGSGTTAAVARLRGRYWLGFDIMEQACWITRQRTRQAIMPLASA